MTLLPENVKNPRKTYFNPFTLFRFCGIKASATATDKAIRTRHTNPEKDKTTARQQSKNADKTWIFAKEKPKSNTFVFDLGFDWRRERDSNPCASFLTTAFRVRLVMTSSISLQSDYVGECPTCVIYNISPDLATILRQFCKNPLIPTAARNKEVMRGKYFVKKRLSGKHNGIRKRRFYRSDDEKSPTFFVIRKRRARRAPTA